ncbi:(5-formylfuran-3-yl)methyl phosphate synthase, partial [uncultured Methylobacterium sp.]|uniref:(5-formylfuran-3-yl)methyl phosphate synthase n=1 Tax=uncultured Methylobacterium sp. TaxID=157278 RepID=UPI002592EB94
MPDPSSSRVRLLVSVRDAAEAALARDGGADLIDGKDPERGALGALPAETVRAIVAVSGDRLTSAVAGEPRDADEASACLAALSDTGVGYLKIAWAPGRDATGLRLPAGTPVIAVLFAEDGPDGADVPGLAAAGFYGALIDTRGKDGRRLTDH